MYEIYNIKETDTLDTIANNYGIDKNLIYEINGLDRSFQIEETRQIILPQKKNEIFKYYKVKEGDTIYKISRENNIDKDLLIKLNGLDEVDYIYPNQTIILPKEGNNLYITKEGDTLKDILKETDINNLLKNNKNIYLQEEQLIILNRK